MYTLINYLLAFWNVAVSNCVHPTNWEYCLPAHEWLIPELIEGYKLWTGETQPYQTEKEYLRKVNPIGDGTALEKR